MIIITVLSVLVCIGEPGAKDECEVRTYQYEAANIVEAEEDWQGCLADRARMMPAECDQFDKDHPPVGWIVTK